MEIPSLALTSLPYLRSSLIVEGTYATVILPAEGTMPPLLADDEDEGPDDGFVDSGLGTSLESGGGRRDSVRKRRGRTSSRDDQFG